jgi:hypothetical protein
MRKHTLIPVFTLLIILLVQTSMTIAGLHERRTNENLPKIYLKSRIITPGNERIQQIRSFSISDIGNKHMIIQFDHIPSLEERGELGSGGIKLLSYVPENAWIAYVDNVNKLGVIEGVTFFDYFKPSDKISPNLLKQMVKGQKLKVSVTFFSDVPQNKREEILTKYGIKQMRLDADTIKRLAEEDEVKWISRAEFSFKTFNDGARAAASVDPLHSAPYNLLGTGVVVAEWDEGWVDTTHDDLSGRVTIGDSGANVSNHSTHVAGTVMGDGTRSSGTYKGMAPNATLISYEWPDFGPSEAIGEANDSIANYGAVISQNSWGYYIDSSTCYKMGDYDDFSQAYDNITKGIGVDGRMTVVFAAGNERDKTYCNQTENPYNTTAGPGGTAKNVITVGAVNSNDNSMTSFSSWGPTDDGRIKPDLVAPGCQLTGDLGITSTITGNTYGTYCGTSQAAPVISGITALIYEKYRAVFGDDPLPSTVKAIMIHTAEDLNNTGPDYTTGWGLVNATRAVNKIAENSGDVIVILEGNVTTTGETDTYYIDIPSGQISLKITLVWDDYPADITSAKQLVNDLDLVVTNSSEDRFYPWTLDKNNPSLPAVRNQRDDTNNVEQVYVENPNAGVWIIKVNATTLPYPIQTYSLVVDNDINEFVPIVTLESPEDGYSTRNSYVDFNCSVSSTAELKNVTLYTNAYGVWEANETKNITGTSNSSLWTLTGISEGNYIWNCLAYDTLNRSNWALQNKTFRIAIPPTWSGNSSNIVTVYSSDTLSFFNISWSDDTGISTVFIEGNWSGIPQNYTMYYSDGVYQYNVTLPGGDHYWRSWANDTFGNWNVSNIWYFSVEKLNSSITLLLNGTEGNFSILEDQDVNLTAYSDRKGNISIYSNGSLHSFGESPLTNVSIFNDPGTYNITAVFNENQNYSSNWTMHWLIVNDTTPPTITNQTRFPPLLLKGENVSIWADVNDNGALSYIHYNISNSTWYDLIIINNISGGFYNKSYNTSNLTYGEYNVSIFANDTAGNNDTIVVGTFEVAEARNVKINIFDNQNNSKNVTQIRVLYNGTNFVRNSSSEEVSSFETIVPKGFWTVDIANMLNATFDNVNLTESVAINITLDDNISESDVSAPSSIRRFIEIIALDVDFNFSFAQIVFKYNDSDVNEQQMSILSCHNWNITNQSCSGSWENITGNASINTNSNVVLINSTTLSAFSVAQNKYCGDGIVDSGESCDGSNLTGNSCTSLGYSGGTLACSSDCTFDTGGCYTTTGETSETTSASPAASGGETSKKEAVVTSPEKIVMVRGTKDSFDIYVNNTGTVTLTNVSFSLSTDCPNCKIEIYPNNQTVHSGDSIVFYLSISVPYSEQLKEYYIKIVMTSGEGVKLEKKIQLSVVECIDGTKICDGSILKKCVGGGRGWSIEQCKYGCVNGTCMKPERLCRRGEVICKDDTIMKCKKDQMGWEQLKECPHGCLGLQCREPEIKWIIGIVALLMIYALVASLLINEIIK